MQTKNPGYSFELKPGTEPKFVYRIFSIHALFYGKNQLLNGLMMNYPTK